MNEYAHYIPEDVAEDYAQEEAEEVQALETSAHDTVILGYTIDPIYQ